MIIIAIIGIVISGGQAFEDPTFVFDGKERNYPPRMSVLMQKQFEAGIFEEGRKGANCK